MRRTGLMLYIYPIDKFYIGRHKSSKESHEIPIRHRLSGAVAQMKDRFAHNNTNGLFKSFMQ